MGYCEKYYFSSKIFSLLEKLGYFLFQCLKKSIWSHCPINRGRLYSQSPLTILSFLSWTHFSNQSRSLIWSQLSETTNPWLATWIVSKDKLLTIGLRRSRSCRVWSVKTLDGSFPVSFTFHLIFSLQLTVNKGWIKIANDYIRTLDLCYVLSSKSTFAM